MCPPSQPVVKQHVHRGRRPRRQIYLLLGPFLGAVLTHIWEVALLRGDAAVPLGANSDWVYAAEVAPQLLLRHKRQVVVAASIGDGDDWSPDDRRYERHESRDGHGECISMHAWQETSFPVCNSIHEMDVFAKYRPDGDVTHITHGGFNELYRYTEHVPNATTTDAAARMSHSSLALKILKYEKDYTQHKFGVVRQDSVTLERLTKSPHIYPIYGYCGFAMIVPFVTGGTLDSKLAEWREHKIELNSETRLQYALDMARGLRDLHNIDDDGIPSATHGDLKEQQYLFGEDGRLLLGDFNKGQFLSKSSITGQACTYKPPSSSYNDKVFRSPEEYNNIQQTAATDIYALGSLFYYMLTGTRVWEEYLRSKEQQKQVRKWIVEGKKPKIDKEILKSQDPVDIALLKIYQMCTVYEPEKRASAAEVVEFLEDVWNKRKKKDDGGRR